MFYIDKSRGNEHEDPVRAIKSNFTRLKRKHKRKRQDYDRIKSNMRHLKKETKKRKVRFNGLRNHVSKMSSLKFLEVQGLLKN